MLTRGIRFSLFLATALLLAAPALITAAETTKPLTLNKEGHRYVKGTVTKITEAAFFIETEEGTVRNYAIKELNRERIMDPKAGDLLVLEFDEGNQIIDIDRVTTLDSDVGEFHQTVLGELFQIDSAKKKVTLQVKGMGKRSYKMKDAAATKLASIKTGTTVLLELDEENGMVNDIDVRR